MDNKIVALCTIALISIVVVLLTSVARVNALSVAYHHRSVDDEQRGVVVGGYNMNHGAASSSSSSDGDGESAMRHDDDVLDAGRSVQRSDANQQQKEVTTMWDTRTIHDDDDEEDDDVDDEEDEDVDVNGEDIINWNEQDKESLRQRILLSLGLESEPEVSEVKKKLISHSGWGGEGLLFGVQGGGGG